MHMVSKTLTLLNHEDIEESDDGDDGQRRGANQRRSDGKCTLWSWWRGLVPVRIHN